MASRFANIVALAAIVTGVWLSPAVGQSVRILGEHNAWTAYATAPESSATLTVGSQDFELFTEAYFYITHRPAQGIRSEINLVSGYQFAPESSATLAVGSQDFDLFTEGDAAWMADPSQSANAVQAIRAGSTMSVTGTSADGQSIRQTFSLSGATAAGRSMDEAC